MKTRTVIYEMQGLMERRLLGTCGRQKPCFERDARQAEAPSQHRLGPGPPWTIWGAAVLRRFVEKLRTFARMNLGQPVDVGSKPNRTGALRGFAKPWKAGFLEAEPGGSVLASP